MQMHRNEANELWGWLGVSFCLLAELQGMHDNSELLRFYFDHSVVFT